MRKKNHQKTKIVATVGPASSTKHVLRELMLSGVDIFRLNFSHGSHDQHLRVIRAIEEINLELGTHVGVIADLQGPKIRIGMIRGGSIVLKRKDRIKFVTKECLGTKEAIHMQYDHFAGDVNPGEKVLCDDGKIVLKVIKTDHKQEVELEVEHGGILSSNKGVNLPDTKVSMPALTKKDRKDLDFILTLPIHWIALSFVRTAEEVRELIKIIDEKGHPAKVIAKIEKPEAVHNIKEIIKASNAIMIARGDLGVEVPLEKVPSIQKNIIKRCIQRARPVIVATQMMESMIKNPSPSRAEITDVANAVLDGTDAVMLSGETAIGDHPVKVVQTMSRIISEAEKHYELTGKRPKANMNASTFLSDVVCFQAANTSDETNATAITGITVTGYSAFKLSSYRPNARICIFSSSTEMLCTLNLTWGVQCFFYDKFTTTDGTIEDICQILKKQGIAQLGDIVINTGSMPIHKRFRTNMMKITVVE